MASVFASETKDHLRGPPLSLSIDTPPSSSPFPSPSSSFLPPPMPGAHEFAVKPPPAGRKKNPKKEDEDSSANDGVNPNCKPNGNRISAENPKRNGDRHSHLKPAPQELSISPATPTPTNNTVFHPPIAAAPQSQSQDQSQQQNRPTSPYSTASTASGRTPTTASMILPPGTSESITATPTSPSHSASPRSSLRDSLTSSRPAPPSPAVSRRASTAPSTTSNRSRSSQKSRPGSTVISRTSSTRKPQRSSLSQTAASASAPASSSASTAPVSPSPHKRRSLLVKIRDFAFTRVDDRHKGLGPDVPKANRVRTLNKRMRGGRWSPSSSSASSSSTASDEEREDAEDSWNGFKWGFGRLSSWGFGRSSVLGGTGAGAGGYVPTSTDFARNFGEEEGDPDPDPEEEGEESEEYGDPENRDCADGEGEGETDGERDAEEGPLHPGLYRALYAFLPEGTAEMALEEEQIVRVIGRGGGVGWAVVEREGSGGHALVPESYLEPVELFYE